MPKPLSKAFFHGDAVAVATRMLGLHVCRLLDGELVAGRIVETEAYRPDDPASHSFRGPTARNQVMFGPAGVAYVYLIYGIHSCLNVVCDGEGVGAAVLIRALEPLSGMATMRRNRFGSDGEDRRGTRGLTSGPGMLCQALDITVAPHNGVPLVGPDRGELWIERSKSTVPRDSIATGPRIGITKATERPWRFWIAGNQFVSR